ncbi:MAG: trigger factor [Pseudomonadales bacterium]
MKISIETTGNLERRLTIVVPSEQFESDITQRLQSAGQQVRLPGFRPGKVPLKEIRRRYGPAVRSEVAGETMQRTFVEAVQQEELSPAGNPSLEVVKMDPGIDFEFTATFEVFPPVPLGDLASIQVQRPEAEITDADMEAMVERLREKRKTFTTVERAAAVDDQVTVDFNGSKDGEPFDGGSGEDVSFVLGAGQMIEDFDSAVTGAGVGDEVKFDATFPQDYQAEHLAGETVQFSVAVKKVEEASLPDLDDEFFRNFDVETGERADFEKEVRQNMQRELDNAVSTQVKQQVMDQLDKLHELQLPAALVSGEIEQLKQQMMQQFQMPPGASAPDLDLPDELFTEQAERRVKLGLLMNEIVQVQSIEADADRVRARVEEMAATYADSAQVVNYYYSNPEQLSRIEMAVVEDQVVDWLLENGQVEAVSASYQDVLESKAVAQAESDAEDDADSVEEESEQA